MSSTPPFIIKSEMKLNFANFHNIWRRKVPSRSFLWTNLKCESKDLLRIFCKLPRNFLDSSIYNVYRPVDISPSWGNVMRIIMADVVSVGTIKWSVISMQELTRQYIITLHHTPTTYIHHWLLFIILNTVSQTTPLSPSQTWVTFKPHNSKMDLRGK